MLACLRVKDFAIIEDLTIEFGEGLNVITGETGAGKSIIINALSSLVQQKVPSEWVRTDIRQAEVTGHFCAAGHEAVLKRIIAASGRSRALVDGEPVTFAVLERAGDRYVNIYGQHELNQLLSSENYIGILDDLLGLSAEREELAARVTELRRLRSQLESKRKEKEGRENERALLEYQITELEREGVKAGEEEDVRQQLKILKDAGRIRECLEAAGESLYQEEGSVLARVKGIAASMRSFAAIEAIVGIREKLDSLSYEIQDLYYAIRDFGKGLIVDPEEVVRLDDRLARINSLKAKYGKTFDEMKDYEQKARERLLYLTELTGDVGELEQERDVLEEDVGVRARRLSERRRAGKGKIEQAITDELRYLSMKGTRFAIEMTQKDGIDEAGMDEIDFLISTNPGEPLKPLRRVASGGELSRVMLAIKSVIGGGESATLIFDEIDAGIGGRVADVVGQRLRDLGTRNQILCITHLPQIAAYGDHHFLVEKHQNENTTRTAIRRLSDRERIEEIARMLGGEKITEKALERAEEMLANVQKSPA